MRRRCGLFTISQASCDAIKRSVGVSQLLAPRVTVSPLLQAARGKGRISVGGTHTGHYSISMKQQAPRQAEA